MAEESSSSKSKDERQDLFRQLQGEITPEQFKEWNDMQTQEHSLVFQTPDTAQADCSEDLPLVQMEAEASVSSLSMAQICSLLDPADPERDSDSPSPTKGDNSTREEEEDSSILGLADAASRASTITQLQQQNAMGLADDFVSFASSNPEVLTQYLTGKMNYEEFCKVVSEASDAVKSRSERSRRKRKADPMFVFEEDEDFEADEAKDERPEEDSEDEAWVADSPKAAGSTKKKRKPRRRQWQLPKDLMGLMGETNVRIANNQLKEAISMCSELIQRAPNASEPYRKLSEIYDELGDTAKANRVLLISACMRQTDCDLWQRTAQRMLDSNETHKGIRCITQAVRFAPDSSSKVSLMLKRSSLYEELGEMAKALLDCTNILATLPPTPDTDDTYLRLARKVCEKYHGMKKTNKAANVLQNMFKNRPSLVNSEDTNKLLDLRMTMKQYQACLENFVDYCGVEVTLQIKGGQVRWNQSSPLPSDLDLKATPEIVTSVKIADNLAEGFPLDLLTKLCSCLIYLGCSAQAKHLVSLLLKEDVEDVGNGDRFLDIADAYMDTDFCTHALPILQRCVHSRSYSQALVWLRYGECLSATGQLSEAVEAFSRVVNLAPNHLVARVSLSALQQQIGRHDEALRVLTADGDGSFGDGMREDQTLLLHRCHLLYSQKHSLEFVAACRKLLFHSTQEANKPEFFKIGVMYRSIKLRLEAMQNYPMEQQDQGDGKDAEGTKEKASKSEDPKVSPSELWDLYLKMCDTLLEADRLDELCEVSMLGLTCTAFINDPVKMKDAEFLCLTVCLMTRNGQYAYDFIKPICLKDPDNIMAWNLFNQTLMFSKDLRHHKFCLRRLMQWPENIALGMINGNNSLENGSYRCALSEYVNLFRRMPKDPLVSLCIGLCYVHMCCQKFTIRKVWLAMQAITFLNTYLSLRGKCQESYYNIGRAMQQLDLGYAAVYYYKKALSLPPVIDGKEGLFDLKREIAFNLSLVYKRSGDMDLARLCLQTHVVI